MFVLLLSWVIPACGFVSAGGLILSPSFAERLSSLLDRPVRVQAHIVACRPRRDGINHRSTIECGFHYSYRAASYVGQSAAWDSDSPFLTPAGLAHALAEQSLHRTRFADLARFAPGTARLVDERPIVMPPLWVWLLGLFIAMGAVAVRLDPSAVPHRRAELVEDPVTGHLVAIDNRRRDRLRRRIALQCLAGGVAMGVCLFGLSNQPANILEKAAMTNLRPTPAWLKDCAHRHHGGSKGHEQIDCSFEYRVGDRVMVGQAESLRFGFFPTKARMQAEVAKLPDGTAVAAYVDPRHPDYAWAFIRTDAFLPFTWGMFELELWVILLVIAIGILASLTRLRHPDGRDWPDRTAD